MHKTPEFDLKYDSKVMQTLLHFDNCWKGSEVTFKKYHSNKYLVVISCPISNHHNYWYIVLYWFDLEQAGI